LCKRSNKGATLSEASLFNGTGAQESASLVIEAIAIALSFTNDDSESVAPLLPHGAA